MKATWILAALCATCSTAVLAQTPVTTRERIEREVAEKQRLMREGKVVLSNVRVTVRLDNGSRLRGVVKNGRFIERHDGLAFVPSDRVREDAGLRIWYYNQTNSYIFLPWTTISEHTIGEILSDEDVERMGLELDERRRAEEAARAAAKAGKQAAKAKAKDPTEATTVDAKPEPEKSPLTPEQTALLEEFPPSGGWSLARLQEIEARKVRIHVYPSEKEQRFLDQFGAWNEANEVRKAHEAKVASQQAAKTPTPPSFGGPPQSGGLPKPQITPPAVPPKPGR